MVRVGRQSGIALVLSILVLAILIVVVLELVYTTRIEESLARNLSEGREADMAADAAVELAQALLDQEKSDSPDTPDSDWAGKRSGLKLGNATVDFEITDESSKFNIRLLNSKNEKVKKWAEESLLRLVKSARTGEELENDEIEPEKIVERISNWAGKGETREDSAVDGIKAGDEEEELRLLSIAELLFLEGFTPELVFGKEKTEEELKEEEEKEKEKKDDDSLAAGEREVKKEKTPLANLLTVWSDGRININTACREVLMALHEGITEETADRIIGHRESEPGAEGGAGAPPPPVQPPAGQAPDPTAEKWFQTVVELRSVEGMVDSAKQLDVLRDLLAVTGKAPAQGKDAKEDYADAPLCVKSGFFKVSIRIKCGRVFRSYTAVLKRKADGGTAVIFRAEGVQ